MNVYDTKPARFLERLFFEDGENTATSICCAGFEMEAWRCLPFAEHLVEWLPEYALAEPELTVDHSNMYVKLKQAAVRVYTSEKYAKRGEAGEIALHAICRDYFGTIPISPRVFYKTASNDVVKSFDLVHARLIDGELPQLWLGEAKLYVDAKAAIAEAIKSITSHLDQGFLKNEKLLIGPQIPMSTPRRDELIDLFRPQTSLDKFIQAAVVPIGILAESDAAKSAVKQTPEYLDAARAELSELAAALSGSTLKDKVRFVLIYVPLADKNGLVAHFDAKLKGLQ